MIELVRAAAVHSVQLAWLGALAILLFHLPAGLRAFRRLPPAARVAWIAVLVGAVLLRVLVPEPAFLNENRHGEMFLRAVLQRQHLDKYGAAWVETFHWIFQLFPRRPETVFLTGAVLGGIGCAVAGVAAVQLFGASRRTGLAAAAMLAVLPVHVRVSHSEALFVLGAFLCSAAMALGAASVRSGRAGLWWAAWLLAAVAGQVRPEYLLFLPFLFTLPMVVPAAPGVAAQSRTRAAATMAGVLLLLPRIFTAGHMEATGGAAGLLAPMSAFGRLLTEANLLFNPALMTPALPALAVLGLAALVWRQPLASLWALVMVAVYTGWALSVESNLGNVLRYQHAILFFWVMLAAVGAAGLVGLLPRPPLRWAMAGGLAALLVVTTLPTARIVHWRFNKDEQLAYLREWAGRLPEKGTLVLQDAHLGGGRILAYFPRTLLPGGGEHWRIKRFSSLAHLGDEVLRRGNFIYFRGTWAYDFVSEELPRRKAEPRPPANPFFDHEETSPGTRAWTASMDRLLRPEAAAFEEHYVLEPVAGIPEHTFDSRPYERWIVPQKRLTLGFYRIRRAAEDAGEPAFAAPPVQLRPAFEALTEPFGEGAVVQGGWRLGPPDREKRDVLVMRLLHDTREDMIELVFTDRVIGQCAWRETPSFSLTYRTGSRGLHRDDEAALRRLVEVIIENDPGGLRVTEAWEDPAEDADPVASSQG